MLEAPTARHFIVNLQNKLIDTGPVHCDNRLLTEADPLCLNLLAH
jgi:hypothetical protein